MFFCCSQIRNMCNYIAIIIVLAILLMTYFKISHTVYDTIQTLKNLTNVV